MKNVLLIDPFSGASGDMLLAALVDAGAPADALRERVLAIPELTGASADFETVRHGAFAARRLALKLPDERTHRGLAAIRSIIEKSTTLSEATRVRACSTFARLAEVEATIHVAHRVNRICFHLLNNDEPFQNQSTPQLDAERQRRWKLFQAAKKRRRSRRKRGKRR